MRKNREEKSFGKIRKVLLGMKVVNSRYLTMTQDYFTRKLELWCNCIFPSWQIARIFVDVLIKNGKEWWKYL